MNQNIKNFILEGEKDMLLFLPLFRDQKLEDETTTGLNQLY